MEGRASVTRLWTGTASAKIVWQWGWARKIAAAGRTWDVDGVTSVTSARIPEVVCRTAKNARKRYETTMLTRCNVNKKWLNVERKLKFTQKTGDNGRRKRGVTGSVLLLNYRRLQQALLATTATDHRDKRVRVEAGHMRKREVHRHQGRIRVRLLQWIHQEGKQMRGYRRVPVGILPGRYLSKLRGKLLVSVPAGIRRVRWRQILHGWV